VRPWPQKGICFRPPAYPNTQTQNGDIKLKTCLDILYGNRLLWADHAGFYQMRADRTFQPVELDLTGAPEQTVSALEKWLQRHREHRVMQADKAGDLPPTAA